MNTPSATAPALPRPTAMRIADRARPGSPVPKAPATNRITARSRPSLARAEPINASVNELA